VVLSATELQARTELGRFLIARRAEAPTFLPPGQVAALPQAVPAPELTGKFPTGLAPSAHAPDPNAGPTDKLPRADVVVVTWTVDENDALAAVLTPGFSSRSWSPYSRRYASHYARLIRAGAPAKQAKRLGRWLRTDVGGMSVVCFKSELHLNQDGIRDPNVPGTASLPVKDLFAQLIDEVQPNVVITTGTSGGVFADHDLGDVVVTRAAKFRLQSEFRNAPFNGKTFRSQWDVPKTHFATATDLMHSFADHLKEPPLLPPTIRHSGKPFQAPTFTPDIKLDGTGDLPEFHPILTTDYFEYGTSANNLQQEGCAVEMGDAVLGLVADELAAPPKWVVVRNLSDPQINGELDHDLQVDYAVWYYEKFGFWTSIMSALTTWAIIAGL
jgi:hypothetical protein